MSGFFKSFLGIAALSTAMIAGMGESNKAEARPYGGYGYRGGYNNYYRGGYNTGYRYNSYRPYYGGGYYNNSYPYGYNSYYYGPRNYIGIGGVRIGW